MIFHCEATFLVISPPSTEAVDEAPTPALACGNGAVPFMDEETCDSTGTGVEVFVAAPGGGVDVPVVEVKGHVAGCVCKIPDYEDTSGASGGGNGGNVEQLASVELDPGEEENRGGGGVCGDYGEDVGGWDCGLIG